MTAAYPSRRGRSIAINSEASYLSEPTFASNKAFQQALKTAPIKELSWEFCEDQPAKAADESFKPAN